MSLHTLYKTKIYSLFDKLEDRIRAWLSRRPKLYAFIAGAAIVMLWRAIWHIADMFEAYGGWFGFLFSPPVTLVTTTLVLLGSGLFVSFFVGDAIIMSGLKREKKFVDHAQEEVIREEDELKHMRKVLNKLEVEMEHIHKGHSHSVGSVAQTETKTEYRSGGGFQPKG